MTHMWVESSKKGKRGRTCDLDAVVADVQLYCLGHLGLLLFVPERLRHREVAYPLLTASLGQCLLLLDSLLLVHLLLCDQLLGNGENVLADLSAIIGRELHPGLLVKGDAQRVAGRFP